MAFVTGTIVIDAPASALNNLGKIEGAMTDNSVGVKHIRTREGAYPYVSAQAFRFWLRQTLENGPWGWKSAPIFREQKIAYTDANPLLWWDDDLLGYMRAPSTRASAVKAREADQTRATETPVSKTTLTRVSPFRVSTLVSIAPVSLVNDFGVMARHEGDPVPHEHQFYRATLSGLISLDLSSAGTFTYQERTGYLNLDQIRIDRAKQAGLEELPEKKAYRLPAEERIRRISALLQGLAVVCGGAKLSLHYTDVSPDILAIAVTRSGNHILSHIFSADNKGRLTLKLEALKEVFQVFDGDVLSTVYFGWVKGYMDEERNALERFVEEDPVGQAWKDRVKVIHPVQAVNALCEELSANPNWLE
ncbi:MAG: type I-B CRISPR-associated protein Cas7/Cst2/DevR [Bacillota bacterium]